MFSVFVLVFPWRDQQRCCVGIYKALRAKAVWLRVCTLALRLWSVALEYYSRSGAFDKMTFLISVFCFVFLFGSAHLGGLLLSPSRSVTCVDKTIKERSLLVSTNVLHVLFQHSQLLQIMMTVQHTRCAFMMYDETQSNLEPQTMFVWQARQIVVLQEGH